MKKQLKNYIFLELVILIALCITPSLACAQAEQGNVITNQIQATDFSAIQQKIDEATAQYSNQLDNINIKEITSALGSGKFSWHPMDILKSLSMLLFGEVRANLSLMLKIIALALITSLLTTLQASFGKKSGACDIAFYACYIVIISLSITVFKNASGDALRFIDLTGNFITIFTPLLMLSLAGAGHVISVSVVQPTIIISTQIIVFIIKNYLLPLAFCTIALNIASNISCNFKLNNLIKLFENIIKWSLGIMLTVFVGLISIQTMVAPNLDALTARTAKYAVGTFVPVVGSVLSDSIGLVFTYGNAIKTAVGMGGLISLLLICVIPLIKCMVQMGIMQFSAAVIEPIADSRLVNAITGMRSGLTLIFIMMITLTIMFLINITIVTNMKI
ncbi:MAG: stage III sporulation protein AE [Clostridiales bacterium]|jgi:stage III sporulation protein AE|nr:stage III sporulation protein AE [Clostridiales bacterium]